MMTFQWCPHQKIYYTIVRDDDYDDDNDVVTIETPTTCSSSKGVKGRKGQEVIKDAEFARRCVKCRYTLPSWLQVILQIRSQIHNT